MNKELVDILGNTQKERHTMVSDMMPKMNRTDKMTYQDVTNTFYDLKIAELQLEIKRLKETICDIRGDISNLQFSKVDYDFD